MQVNKETGFLEDVRPGDRYFDSNAKKKFLSLAQNYIDKHHNFPPVSDICRAVGIRLRTFYNHQKWDPTFKQDWKELQAQLESHFVQLIGEKARRPNNTIANLAALRYLTQGTDRQGYWGGDTLNPNSSNAPSKGLISQFSEVIDAEIVPDSPQIPNNSTSNISENK